MHEENAMELDQLREEYDLARGYTQRLYQDVPEADVLWRPEVNSSSMGWHLGHQAAVNHYMIRNLLDAEVSLNPAFDALFDSANPEANRGDLPPLADIIAYRDTIAERTHARIASILKGERAAAAQLAHVLGPILLGIIHHEYQHDCWIGEMRAMLGHGAPPDVLSSRVQQVDGYWVLPLSSTTPSPSR
jgi:hypothetical protein